MPRGRGREEEQVQAVNPPVKFCDCHTSEKKLNSCLGFHISCFLQSGRNSPSSSLLLAPCQHCYFPGTAIKSNHIDPGWDYRRPAQLLQITQPWQVLGSFIPSCSVASEMVMVFSRKSMGEMKAQLNLSSSFSFLFCQSSPGLGWQRPNQL